MFSPCQTAWLVCFIKKQNKNHHSGDHEYEKYRRQTDPDGVSENKQNG